MTEGLLSHSMAAMFGLLRTIKPTAQFYRINVDNLFPYNIYAGQQDNTSVKIASRNTQSGTIGERQWTYSAGGEYRIPWFRSKQSTICNGGKLSGHH